MQTEKTEWEQFMDEIDSGRLIECGKEKFFCCLKAIPPICVSRNTLPDGRTVTSSFGFAEGAGPLVKFWQEDGKYFCRSTNLLNPRV